jgi:hypothetical protein
MDYGNLEEAMSCFKRALAITEKLPAEERNNQLTVHMLINIGTILHKKENYEE